MLAYWQPAAGLQESFVHTLPSSQFNAAPPQAPPAQVSLVVHAFPSSHGAELLAWAHPVSGSQKSSVQTLPSLQLGGGPPTHAPPEQTYPEAHPEHVPPHPSVAPQSLPPGHLGTQTQTPDMH